MFKDYTMENEALEEMVASLIENAPIEAELTEDMYKYWTAADLNGMLSSAKEYLLLGRIMGIVDVCDLYGIEIEGLDTLREYYIEE